MNQSDKTNADSQTVAASSADPPRQLHENMQLGEFKILRLLGKGGMGEVYLAEQTSLRRNVALKTLRRELVDDANYLRRFEAEAKAVAPISHPNIVSVIAIGFDQNIHYIAFEYVQGLNLREYIGRKGPLEIPVFLSVLKKVALALERAAEEGIVHRDIKPENVLLTRKGEVKVADFGLARQMTADRVELTQSGVTMGTPLYMSPEQVEGKPVDHRSDLYSLGVMCYHMLAGEPPYRGETAVAVALQHLKASPRSLADIRPDCPHEAIAIVEKMMAKEASRRYQTAQEILRDLAKLRTRIPHDADFTLTLDDSTTIARTLAVDPPRHASRLAATMSQFTGVVRSPRYRPWVVAVSLIFGFAIGGVGAWLKREPAILTNKTTTFENAHSKAANIPKQENAWTQLAYAREILPAKDAESGLWAVLEYYKGAENETVAAAMDLLRRYLPKRRYDLATEVAAFMAERENPKQATVGQLFRGIIESRQGKASESNKSFVELFERARTQGKGKEISLPQTELDWVARQYLLALRVNYEQLGKPVSEQMIDNFWTTFLPPIPPARGGRRP